MAPRTMGMVAQDFDHTALTDAAMAAFLHHAVEFFAQSFEFLDAQFNLFKMGFGNPISRSTAGIEIIR